ncbi:Ribosomal RNA-processing protein 7 [Chytriomyces hyalinus]|nr:Ribosomal RNA-processing protein 7 [Chytriomyces hyalinus]
MGDKEKLLPRLGEFVALAVTIPGEREVTHTVLFKKDSGPNKGKDEPEEQAEEDDEDEKDRTLFVANLPSDASEAHLRRLFRRCGAIDSVVFSTPSKGSTRKSLCHVRFADSESIVRCLEMRKRRRVWSDEVDAESTDEPVHKAPIGLEKWVQGFIAAHPPLASLEAQVNSYMQQYDEMNDSRLRELDRRRNEPDEDGFILVGGAPKPKLGDNGLPVSAGGNRKKRFKKAEHVDFYRFQMRESKRNQLAELRKKFEEDKKRIEKLKESRKFKPY